MLWKAASPDLLALHGIVARAAHVACLCNSALAHMRRYFPTLLIVLLAVFNDGAMIALSKDRVVASRMPNSWHLGAIFGQGMPLKPWGYVCSGRHC